VGRRATQDLDVMQPAMVLPLDTEALFGAPSVLLPLNAVGVRLVHHTVGVARPIRNWGEQRH
jgi:hypothetical protein